MKDFKPRSRLVLEELLGNVAHTTPQESVPEPIVEEPPSDPSPVESRRSGRVVRQPDRYMSYGETLVAVSDKNDNDPLTYAEAMAGPEAKAWQTAMESKIH